MGLDRKYNNVNTAIIHSRIIYTLNKNTMTLAGKRRNHPGIRNGSRYLEKKNHKRTFFEKMYSVAKIYEHILHIK